MNICQQGKGNSPASCGVFIWDFFPSRANYSQVVTFCYVTLVQKVSVQRGYFCNLAKIALLLILCKTKEKICFEFIKHTDSSQCL